MQEQWTVIYGNAFAFGCSKRIGLRAETELPNESVEQFVVVPFLTDRARTTSGNALSILGLPVHGPTNPAWGLLPD